MLLISGHKELVTAGCRLVWLHVLVEVFRKVGSCGRVLYIGNNMPLMTCPDCGKQVSDRAATCIGCGAPLVEAPALAQLSESSPSSVSYRRKTDRFHGTMPLLAKLCVRAVQDLKWKVDSVNDSVGLVTFQTGVTWGSWSGVSGSLSIAEQEPFVFQVVGTGKQNLSGGQLVALNIGGEAQKKAQKVIDKMKELSALYIEEAPSPTMGIEELERRLAEKR
jgi:predicted RNA-binding Zn-ribbon protein involved in translation (DUF1610 family)